MTTTTPEVVPISTVRRARNLRRVTIGILMLFLLGGLLGFWGVKTETKSASGGGYDMSVEYASVSRPGLATPWSVKVHRAGGFDGPITIATDGRYFDLFDENGFDPQATSEINDGEMLVWEFDPPEGDTLNLSFDARIEPGAQSGGTGLTQVRVGGRPVVSVKYHTRLMP